jgi:hypothetical protein
MTGRRAPLFCFNRVLAKLPSGPGGSPFLKSKKIGEYFERTGHDDLNWKPADQRDPNCREYETECQSNKRNVLTHAQHYTVFLRRHLQRSGGVAVVACSDPASVRHLATFARCLTLVLLLTHWFSAVRWNRKYGHQVT